MNDRGSAPANEVDERQVETPSANWLANKKVWIAALSAVLILVLILGLILIPRGSDDQEAMPESNSVEKSEGDTSVVLDSDGDGILDVVEVAGWKTEAGATYATDPKLADTDGDGLNDSEEAGAEVSEGVYKGVANPLKSDSDDDGLDDKTELAGGMTLDGRAFTLDPQRADTDADQLSDLDEVDYGTHPNLADTDGDGLDDFYELYVIGTDALSLDTDGDSYDDAFEDANRASRELDPQFPDVQVTKTEWATDVAQGVLFGDLMEKDTVPFFIGMLSVGALGFIPIIGGGLSSVADIRDAIAALVKQDYVTCGIALVGIIPFAGDAVALGKKVEKFIARAPHLAPQVAGVISRAPKFTDDTKEFLLKKVWGQSWDHLISEGSTKASLIRLSNDGRTNITFLSKIIKERPGHKKGRSVSPMKDGRDGEEWLKKNIQTKSGAVSSQKVLKTDGCVQVCNSSNRRFDVFADGIAHESKVGYTTLTESIKKQIESDAYLMKTGQIDGAQWHFFPSEIAQSGRLGPSEPLLDLLDQHGIKYTIHLPK
ncbi:hypothetical protein [Corynebacterium callunae]|uniref:von Willebrand factor type A n=1 Tax=Corynebacterium callunae DSM 20147 TaxID=1121353 RepID=M1UJ13_9CORY|nr:hypothetical protein [Corynebacterium callunae]AGG65779.1 von Willebrand factor type A [Corynebacterium callunae DSM 20147]